MDIGFIGIGAMGHAMARNLLQAGHKVTVYNRTREKAEALIEDGAVVADSAVDAARNEIVITLLADDPAVEKVVLDGAFIPALAPDAIHISMATISAALSRRLTETHREAGRLFVAAPVFGRPDAAAAGKLFIVVAGPAEATARCQPVFDVLGQRTFPLGEDPVAANVMKISGNFLIASVIESLGEAFALTRKYGLDPEQYLEILTSTIFSAPVYKTYGGLIAHEKYEPAGFKMPLGLKDVRLALAAGEAANVPMPTASLIRDQFVSALARGYQDLDWSALALVSAENAALERKDS
jgi:3-hydroxyisobutyrate dehydrogenase-like beta-hydroxyacid dehydrogenase